MNKILVLGIQDCNSHYYIKCAFTFDKILYKNVKFDIRWISELTENILPLQVFEKENFDKYIEIINQNQFNLNPKCLQEFLDTHKTLYTYNDYNCVEYTKYFHRYTKNSITLICISRINPAIYENGIYIFDEPIRKNTITNGAIKYLKELKSKEYTEPLDVLIWIHNLTDTLKTLIRWYY